MTPAQCRAARGLLDWTQDDLAEASGVSVTTVRAFEANGRKANRSTVTALKLTLESAGIFFIPADTTAGPGLRLKDPQG